MGRRLNPFARRGKKRSVTIRAAWIAGGCAVLAAIIATLLAYGLPSRSPATSFSPHLEVDEITLTSAGVHEINETLTPFKIDIKLLNTGKGVAAINDARLIIQQFATLPQCAAQGDFVPTGAYTTNMPINPEPLHVVNVPVSQLVQPNGADRFDLLLGAPLVQGEMGPNVYIYRIGLYLMYNIGTTPLDAGEMLVDFPYAPVYGEYFWSRHLAADQKSLLGVLTADQMPAYRNCVTRNSNVLRSILSLPAKRVPQLAAILSQLRY